MGRVLHHLDPLGIFVQQDAGYLSHQLLLVHADRPRLPLKRHHQIHKYRAHLRHPQHMRKDAMHPHLTPRPTNG